jgi:archaeal flagellar protein FlaJ
MRITKKQIKKITLYSTTAGICFFIISAILFLTSPTLDYMIVIALSIAIGPPSIANIIHSRWKNKIEKETPEFLRDLATASRTGIPLQVALEHASERQYGPLTYELKVLVANMSWGMNFNEALSKFADRIDLLTLKKATTLIIEAGKHGGDLSNIFDSTAQYVENVNAWNARRKMQTMPYIAIFYFSVFIFLFIIIIVTNMMFGAMSQASGTGASFIQPILTQAESKRIFFHTALFESIFGGLIAGKINEESFADGLKHAMILCIVSGVAFYLFLG